MRKSELLKKQQLYVNIEGKRYPILGRIGTYHINIDISCNENIKINDEVIFNCNLKHIDTSVKREWI